MIYHVLTLFPEIIRSYMDESITGRAIEDGVLELNTVNIRDYSTEKHKKVDDYPYGGGAGMLMQAQPIYDSFMSVTEGRPVRCIFLTPQGKVFNQQMAREFATEKEVVFLCGRYEGVDERVIEEIVTDEVSIGDYVVTGGELPAMIMMDAIARMIPGVLHNEESAESDSFYGGLLEHPQYTRPEIWRDKRVPEILLSGDHAKVDDWRRLQSIKRTALRRPDLLENAPLSPKEREFVENVLANENTALYNMSQSDKK